jgi:colicin import membrane protein
MPAHDRQRATATPRFAFFQKLPAVSLSAFHCAFPVLRGTQAARNPATVVTRQVRERAVIFLQEPLAREQFAHARQPERLLRRLYAENKQMRSLLALQWHPLFRSTKTDAEQVSSSHASQTRHREDAIARRDPSGDAEKQFEAERAKSAAAAAEAKKTAEDNSTLRRQLEAERTENSREKAAAQEEIASLRKQLQDLRRAKDRHAAEHLAPG